MEPIVKQLTGEFLISWGFTFVGGYYEHPNYPFKLTPQGDGQYNIDLENAPIGQTPPPVKTNSDLMNLITACVGVFIQSELKKSMAINQQAQGELVTELISRYFSFDSNIKFDMIVGPGGQGGLAPSNEYTHTLMSGHQMEFKITLEDGTVESLIIAPECISKSFIESKFNQSPVQVMVRIGDGEDDFDLFFGVGIPKVPQNSTKDLN